MKIYRNKVFIAVGTIGIVAALSVAGGAGMVAAYEYRVLPGVSVGSIYLGGMEEEEAMQVLSDYLEQALERPIELYIGGEVVARPVLSELGLELPVIPHVQKAVQYGRNESGLNSITGYIRGTIRADIALQPLIDHDKLHDYIQQHLSDWMHDAESAHYQISNTGTATLVPGESGVEIDTERLAIDLANVVNTAAVHIPIVLKVQQPEITTADAMNVQGTVNQVMEHTLTLTVDDKEYPVRQSRIPEWMLLEKRDGRIVVTADKMLVTEFLEEQIIPLIDQEPQNARFELQDGRAVLFNPPQDGLEVDIEHAVAGIRDAIETGSETFELPVIVKGPDITTTADIERLGIRELIGKGESDFRGSPVNRMHNIRVGTSRFHGLLIAPGEVFAFNKNLGPVNGAAGYLYELVILHDVTTPQYGGGLCQVSTTAFRAAVNSGLEIVERRNHAYPVSYYGAPGFDSTIYPNQRTWRDGTDLKFRNNTDNHILIQARVEGTKNIFELWGTSDGREVVVEGPYAYDRRPDGSVKATLKQKVYRDDELLFEKVFYSSYKSPALYPLATEANKEE